MTIEQRYIDIANDVIDIKIEALQSLRTVLDDEFFELISDIAKLKGRVIVSGIGKSGHVARKFAATLASTGTAAYFVHPAEASHGDLGMISKDDVVILLSNSGDTVELKDIIYHCKRFAIKLVAIVRNRNSILADAADIALVLPNIKEASSLRAPTTSTTMMIVLGDIMSILVQVKKGFSIEDYHILHPGGKLGAAFIKVENIMHTGIEIPIISYKRKMSEALIEMTRKKFGCVAIIDDDNDLLGIITDGDLRRHMSNNLLEQKTEQVMTRNPLTIDKDCFAIEALEIMNSNSRTNLLVTELNKVIGIVHIHDCLRVGAK